MKHKTLRTLLCVILTVCFCMSAIVPASAAGFFGGDWSAASTWDQMMRNLKDWFGDTDTQPGEDMDTPAADTYDTTSGTNSLQYRIVHLDCGRKYFSKDWIIALLYEMKADGYNQLQLAFGNDGLRFLLDDMSFTANGTTYDFDTIKTRVELGNKTQNSSGDERWLTETEMDEIIAKATELGIEIVPLLNLPGHANTVLCIANGAYTKYGTYNVSGSYNTINFENDAAYNFAIAIFKEYVDYFASKGCRFFSFGADEYANDISGGYFSFSRLSLDAYKTFVAFINEMASYIQNKTNANGVKMTPRAFNDGLYYDRTNTQWQNVSIDTAIQCCYWSSGWGSYPVAYANTISNKGHSMINTHGDYYYVLGLNDQNANKDKFHTNGYTYASGFSNTSFAGGTTISSPIGSMFCIWCDDPTFESETEIAANTRLILRAMGLRMQDKSIDDMDTTSVVTNGFNADGTINTTKTDPGGTDTDTETTVTINLVYGGDPVEKTVSGDVTGSVNDSGLNTDISTVSYNYKSGDSPVAANDIVSGTSYYISDGNGNYLKYDSTFEEITNTTKKADATQWKFEKKGTIYYISCNDGYLRYSGSLYVTTYANNATEWFIYNGSLCCYYSGYRYLKYQNYNWTANYYSSGNKGNPYPKGGTTITFTPVFPGTTYITIGNTKYEINVAYKTQNVSVITGSTTTVEVSGDLNTEDLNTEVATVAISGTTMTISGVATGTTSVKVGGVQYNITVADEDLDAVTPLTVEYWITNGRSTDDTNKNYLSVNATDTGVATENGIALADIVPEHTTKDGRTIDYWCSRLLDKTLANESKSGTEEQTGDSEDDETTSGVVFTKVRYYGSVWSVYTENNEWVTVEQRHQLVAYYLEHIKITDEVDSHAADWGKKGDGSTSGDYLDPNNVNTISIQVVYEDGTTNPVTTDADGLKSKTIAYGYWSAGRGIGTIILDEISDYEIYKVSAETGAMTGYGTPSTTATTAYGSYTVTSFTWDDNEQTVWEGQSNGQVVLHNNARVPETTGIYKNLHWDENYEAILIRVYVRTKVTEDSLKVNYFDENDLSAPFYNYNISVKKGTTFDPNFKQSGNGLINNTVKNINDVTQTVQSDLTKMTEIGAQYRYGNFTLTGCQLSEDGKTVNLYYKFNRKAEFVVDFGLPITITPVQVNKYLATKGTTLDSVSVSGLTYGSVVTDDSDMSFTYTPTKPIDSIEHITVTYYGHIYVEDDNGALKEQTGYVSYEVYIIPATNVYYEESFMTPSGSNSWRTSTAPTTQQTTELGGAKTYVYGYEQELVKDNTTNYSGNSAYVANLTLPADKKSVYTKDNLTFSFTGAGFDLISECGKDTGMVVVRLENAKTKEAKVYIIDTYFHGDNTILNNTHNIYQTPVIRELALVYGTYNVTIRGALYKNSGTVVKQPAAADVSTYSMQASAFAVETETFDIRAFLDDCGFEDVSVDDVELVYMDENSVLNGGTGIQSEAAAPVERSAAFSTYAMNAETEAASSTEARVTIDGFRVYNPLKDGSDVYTTDKESGVKYNDLSKYIQSNSTTGALPKETKNVMYVEYKSELQQAESANYNSKPFGTNGPKYEIYLAPNCGIAVGLPDDFNEDDILQLSAKIVSGTPTLKIGKNNGSFKEITVGNQNAGLSLTGTEMYYDISDCIQQTTDGKKFITIINGTTATEEAGNKSVLAVNVLKMSEKKAMNEMSEETQNYILASLTESMATPIDDTFEPEVFEVYAPTTARRNRTFSISANVSVTDLEKVTIAADDGTETELNALNRVSVKWGISSEYFYLKTFRMRDSGEHTFKITAYGKDGSSVSKTVTVLVK